MGIINLFNRLFLYTFCFFFNWCRLFQLLFELVFQLNTLVDYNCFKLRERPVDQFFHGIIRRKGYLVTPFNHNTFPRVHIDTLAGTDTCQLKCTQSLYLNLAFTLHSFINDIYHQRNEMLGISHLKPVLINQTACYIFHISHCHLLHF